jgi:hypothetical protein
MDSHLSDSFQFFNSSHHLQCLFDKNSDFLLNPKQKIGKRELFFNNCVAFKEFATNFFRLLKTFLAKSGEFSWKALSLSVIT